MSSCVIYILCVIIPLIISFSGEHHHIVTFSVHSLPLPIPCMHFSVSIALNNNMLNKR